MSSPTRKRVRDQTGHVPTSDPIPPSSPPLRDEDMAVEADAFDDEIEDAVQDLDDMDEEMDGEDLFNDNMMRDYRDRAEEDFYDPTNLDDEDDYDDMDVATRRAVEAKLNKRDRELERRGGLQRPPAFLDSEDDPEFTLPARRRRHYDSEPAYSMDGSDAMMDEEISAEALGDIKAATLQDWLIHPPVRRAIAREFRTFLLEYTNEIGESVYGARINNLGERNLESLEVDYSHLRNTRATVAKFLAQCPTEVLKIFDATALQVILLNFPTYDQIHPEIHVRITDMPTRYSLRDLRQDQLNSLVKVGGVVTRRGGVWPMLKWVKFDCQKCGQVLGPFTQEGEVEIRVGHCFNCQSRGPFALNSTQTVYKNYQKLTLQESPGTVPPGRLPRQREVILLWDLIDSAKPGEEVEITGIYRNSYDAGLNMKNGFPVFKTVIEANYVSKKTDEMEGFRLSEDDERKIKALSRDPQIAKRIVDSIAPSIYGHEDIKTAVAMSLFGGVPKDIGGKANIRGDINVLLLGDPGTAKSQILKYVEKTAHRAVFTTGQGASAVGLTASVHKDPVTSEWTLEGGALVLADKGTCLIDEFDKMNDQDRTSIHEAMEQQTISISKAGIVTTLQARCSIIAAANPVGGRYNATVPFAQNVQLTEPILSRFDVLCVVKDTVDPEVDEFLARFVVGSHLRSHPEYMSEVDGVNLPADMRQNSGKNPIEQALFRKYIKYARERCRPQLASVDKDMVSGLFVDLRRESLKTGSFPVTVRHLEAIIRIAEAHAKMHLRDVVIREDIQEAMRVTIQSFIGAQKISVKKSLSRTFAQYTLPRRVR